MLVILEIKFDLVSVDTAVSVDLIDRDLCANERLGWDMKRSFAASFMEPVSAMVITYFNCVSVITCLLSVDPGLLFSLPGS